MKWIGGSSNCNFYIIFKLKRFISSLKSTPQKHSSYGLGNRVQFLPRGKGLGGSHQLNYLLHFSGLKQDFDRWKRLDAEGWDYENLKYFLNRHDLSAKASTDNEDQDSPKLSITSVKKEDSKLSEAFLKAGNEMQMKINPNVTFNLAEFTLKRGIRHSVFHEYLRRAYKHKNLSIIIHAKVLKIEFLKKVAVSVIVETSSRSNTRIYATREIILSAGAFHSPQILKLSGIGNFDELKSKGINLPLVHHLPKVGENLFDHMNLPLFVSINETASVTKNKILSAGEIVRYLIEGKGVFSTTGVVGVGRLNDQGLVKKV